MSTTLSQLGEFGLIELLKKYKGSGAPVVREIGDDTAVVPLDARRYLLLTTDMLMEGVHFPLLHARDGDHDSRVPPFAVGRKALGCSLSDIAAMGGVPHYALVSLGVPAHLSWEFVRDMYKGMDKLAREFHVAIVGGDTVRSSKILINVALTGEVRKTDIVYRKGARPGDCIFVTGPLGKSLPTGWHWKFTPRIKEAQHLVRYAKPTAMIDISDGLTADLGHILEQSKAGAVLEEKKIPLRAGASVRQALHDGEDFELLFTVAPRKAAFLLKQRRFPFYPIGEIVASRQGLTIRDKKGKFQRIVPQGYRHF